MNDESKLSNVTKKITKVDSISDEEFIKLVKNSNNISEISEKIGYSSPTKSGRKSIKNRIETLNLDTSHFKKVSTNSTNCSIKSEMSTKQLGNIGESAVLAKFVRLKVPVYIPYGDNERADLIAEFNGKLNKIQVKTSEFSKNNRIMFSLLSCTRSRKHMYDESEIDYFALYNLQEDILLLIPIEEVKGKTSISFNISEKILNKNQYKLFNWKDFLFENIIKFVN